MMLIQVESVHTAKENRESIAVANKETGLEVNADKTQYMVMSRDQNARQSHNIKIDYSSLERVEQLQYLGLTLTNQNFPPMPPHVLSDLVVSPPPLWLKCNQLLKLGRPVGAVTLSQ